MGPCDWLCNSHSHFLLVHRFNWREGTTDVEHEQTMAGRQSIIVGGVVVLAIWGCGTSCEALTVR